MIQGCRRRTAFQEDSDNVGQPGQLFKGFGIGNLFAEFFEVAFLELGDGLVEGIIHASRLALCQPIENVGDLAGSVKEGVMPEDDAITYIGGRVPTA